MKKRLLLLLGVLIALPALAQTFEYEYKGKTLVYEITSWYSKTCQVGDNSGDRLSGDVEIPAVVVYNDEEYTVTSLAYCAFFNCHSLNSVVIPNTITSISNSAFEGSSITSVEIPETVTSIGLVAFRYCHYLTSVVIPEAVTKIERETFAGCSSLASVVIPDGVTKIDESAFANCSSLTSVVIPNSVTSLGTSAFYDCSSVASVEISNSLNRIGERVFSGCSSLTSIEIPNSVTAIAEYAFAGCTSLTSVVIPNSVTEIDNNVFQRCSSLTSVVIPNSVTSIRSSAFSGCTSLTSIEIPNSVTAIADYAFFQCSSLTSVVIPNSVTSIRSSAFSGCTSLTSIEIPNSVTAIAEYAFAGCTSLTSIEIPNSVTEIDNDVFQGCSSLDSVEIPNSVTSIGESAFGNCSSLNTVVIPESVTSIGSYAFSWCNNLGSFILLSSNIEFGENILYGTNLWYVIAVAGLDCTPLNCSVKYFDPETTEILPDGTMLTDNGKTLYYAHVEPNTSYAIPEGVTKVLAGAIDTAPSATMQLESLTIPSTLVEIEADAFRYAEIGKVIFNDWTSWCVNAKLGNLYANPYWNSTPYSGGLVMTTPVLEQGMTCIPDYVNYGLQFTNEVELPTTIKRIGAYAFYNNKELYSVILPAGLEEIGESAFEGCNKMESIVIPSSVKSVGSYALTPSGLKYLIILSDDVTFGEQAASPGMYVFAPEGLDCAALGTNNVKIINPETTVVADNNTILTDSGKTLFFVHVEPGSDYAIPEGVTKLLNGAIDTAPAAVLALKSLTIPSTLVEIEADAFRYAEIGKVIFNDWTSWCVNAKLGNLYANPYWNSTPYSGGLVMTTPVLEQGMTCIPDYVNYGLQFTNEVELPTTIKRIGAYAFYNNKELYSVILPAGLEEIGESAFEGCELLENPSFPAGLKKIEDGAYKDCIQITEVTLPSGLNYLGEMTPIDKTSGVPWDLVHKGVFEGCKALERAVVVADIDYLDDKLFYGCRNLQTIFLPLELKTIGSYTFYNSALDEITFPATLESIGEYAFSGEYAYGKITRLVIPNSVTAIGEGAFRYQGITNLTLGSGLKKIESGVFCNNPLQIVNFSDGLEEIAAESFAWGGNISTVNLPSTVTAIGDNAFGNVSICEMNVPDGVTSLPQGSCGRPSVLTLGSGIREINANAFSFDKLYTLRLKAYTPPTLSDAFPLTEEQNDQLTLIVNPGRHDYYTTNARWKQIDNIIEEGQSEAVIYMTGDNAISTEIRLTTGLMPSSVTKMKVVGPLTANDLVIIKENMAALTSLDMSEVTNVTAIPENQFNGSMLTDIVLPAGLTSIGDGAFANCGLLQIAELPASLKTIGSGTFAGSVRVDISTLPESLESVGYYAFSGTAIRGIVANEALASLGEGAFTNCNQLQTVDFSASVLSSIPSSAFAGCYELDQVLLPESVSAIGDNAFTGTALRNIDFTAAVETIGYGAFSGNRRLVAATLPNSLQTVGSNLFADCPRLIAVSMPSTTTTVSTQILNGDRKLANISCAALKAPEAESGAFDGLRMRYVSLIVPTLSYQSYLDAPGWGKFQTIKNKIPVEIDPGVDASAVSEDEYQQMLEEDALEEAEEAAAQEQNPELEPMARRRAAQRAATSQYFASLFNGAQIQTGDDDSGTRVFINPREGIAITSILFDGAEMLPQYLEEGSLLLPQGAQGSLRIITDAEVVEPSIELDETDASVVVGMTMQLTATVTGLDDTDVTWSSSDESIATVDATGLVTGINAGTATIIAKASNGLEASCKVTVVTNIVDATAITLNVTEASLEEGETLQLTATVTPTDATDKTLTWTSSDESVATVDPTGIVTAIHAGTAVITATTSNGLEAICEVTVVAKVIEPTDITLNFTNAKILEGETVQLTATVAPADATDQSVVWSSNDATIAAVDQTGLVSGLKVGIAVITATTANGLTAECVVTVDEMTGIDDIDAEISVDVRDHTIIVTAPYEAEVEVFSTNGSRVALTREHRIEILVDGVYIVRVADRIFKVVVR